MITFEGRNLWGLLDTLQSDRAKSIQCYAPGRFPAEPGEGEPVAVSGPLAELTAWLAGRSHQGLTTAGGGALPPLPTWL